MTATIATARSAATIPYGMHSGSTGWTHDLDPLAWAAGVVIISTLAIRVIAMASVPVASVAGEIGAAIAFGVILDLMKITEFARLHIF